MSARFLLDTDVLSEPLRPRPDPTILGQLERFREELATAAPVVHEIVFGWSRLEPSRRRDAIGDYLRQVIEPDVPILPYDAAAARWHGLERARLARAGRTPPFVDGQIAAVAAVNDLILVTLNAADYRGFRGVQVQDWRR